MRWWSAAIVGGLWSAGHCHASDVPPLPEWNAEQRAEMVASGWMAGADLLAAPAEEEPVVMDAPNPEEIAGDAETVVGVPEEFFDAYFAARPEKFLIDPQRLLSEREFAGRLEFLNYHASDSSIDLFVYLVQGDQEFPSEVRVEELAERFFRTGRPATVLFYHLGAPQRSTLLLSPALTDVVSTSEQNRALESSVIQALEKSDPIEQLERFMVQMSIRAYWMERKLGGQPTASADVGEAVAPAALPAATVAKPMKFEALRQRVKEYGVAALVVMGGLLGALGLRYWSGSRMRHRFPDFEVEPRLGGRHAAGIGAVISFASTSQPPASQRKQMPDYLRRARPSSIG